MNTFLQHFNELLNQSHTIQSNLISKVCENMCLNSCEKLNSRACFKQFKNNTGQLGGISAAQPTSSTKSCAQCTHHETDFVQDLNALNQQIQHLRNKCQKMEQCGSAWLGNKNNCEMTLEQFQTLRPKRIDFVHLENEIQMCANSNMPSSKSMTTRSIGALKALRCILKEYDDLWNSKESKLWELYISQTQLIETWYDLFKDQVLQQHAGTISNLLNVYNQQQAPLAQIYFNRQLKKFQEQQQAFYKQIEQTWFKQRQGLKYLFKAIEENLKGIQVPEKNATFCKQQKQIQEEAYQLILDVDGISCHYLLLNSSLNGNKRDITSNAAQKESNVENANQKADCNGFVLYHHPTLGKCTQEFFSVNCRAQQLLQDLMTFMEAVEDGAISVDIQQLSTPNPSLGAVNQSPSFSPGSFNLSPTKNSSSLSNLIQLYQQSKERQLYKTNDAAQKQQHLTQLLDNVKREISQKQSVQDQWYRKLQDEDQFDYDPLQNMAENSQNQKSKSSNGVQTVQTVLGVANDLEHLQLNSAKLAQRLQREVQPQHAKHQVTLQLYESARDVVQNIQQAAQFWVQAVIQESTMLEEQNRVQTTFYRQFMLQQQLCEYEILNRNENLCVCQHSLLANTFYIMKHNYRMVIEELQSCLDARSPWIQKNFCLLNNIHKDITTTTVSALSERMGNNVLLAQQELAKFIRHMELYHDRIYYYILCQQAKQILALQTSIVQYLQCQFTKQAPITNQPQGISQNTNKQQTENRQQEEGQKQFKCLMKELDYHCNQSRQSLHQIQQCQS